MKSTLKLSFAVACLLSTASAAGTVKPSECTNADVEA